MNKNIKQNEQNKRKFKSILIEPLKERNYSKKELIDLYNYSDRGLRNEIAKISMFYPVVSYSSQSGYRIVDTEEICKSGDLNIVQNEREEIQHTANEINSRIKMLKKKLKPLIASDKVLATKEEQLKEVSK